MSFFYSNAYILSQRKIAYPYIVTTPPAGLPLTLAEVKTFLKLDPDDTSEDSLLTMLIQMATDIGEKYTGRDFINKSYTTYRDDFIDPLEIRRSNVSSITSISYLLNNVLTVVASSIYALEFANDFPYIYVQENQQFPDDCDDIPQAVKIVFISGYGADESFVPAGLKLAMLMHINMLYANRGDCCDCAGGASAAGALPSNLQILYNPYKIITIGSYERPQCHPGY